MAQPDPVEVWVIDLDDDAAPAGERLASGVSDDELIRARRIASPERATRWLRSRVALRRVLAARHGGDPLDVVIVLDSAGKPGLADPTGSRFSVSHSGGLALVAIRDSGSIGVDLERARPVARAGRIARRAMGDAAGDEVDAADAASRAEVFLRLWVRHEAAVKCRGIGVAASIGRDATTGLVLIDVDAGPEFAAALAVDRPGSGRVTRREFSWTP